MSPIHRDEVGADNVIGPAHFLLGTLVVGEVGGVPDDEIGAIDGPVLDEAIQARLLGEIVVIDLLRPVAQEPQVTTGKGQLLDPLAVPSLAPGRIS